MGLAKPGGLPMREAGPVGTAGASSPWRVTSSGVEDPPVMGFPVGHPRRLRLARPRFHCS